MYKNYTLYTSTPCTKNTHHVQKRIHHVQNMYTGVHVLYMVYTFLYMVCIFCTWCTCIQCIVLVHGVRLFIHGVYVNITWCMFFVHD